LKVALVFEKMRSNRLAWYGHVMRWDESHITKRVMTMNVDAHPSRRQPRKRWKINAVSMEVTSDRREWRKKTCCADPSLWDKGTMMMNVI
jgi:hypothetical protein